MISVTKPGSISKSPPAIMRSLSGIFIWSNAYPLKPAATPKIPIKAVMITCTPEADLPDQLEVGQD